MAMYHQLLAELFESRESAGHPPMSRSELHAFLAERRARLAGRARGLVDDLSAELEYDLALLHAGRQLGIDRGPEHFTHPSRGRSELEHALAEHGLDLGGTGGAPA